MINIGADRRGFTLVELAIVMVIVGLLIGMGAGLLGPLTKSMKFKESRQAVRSARESLLGFAVINGYLPDDKGTNPLGKAGARGKDVWGSDLLYFADNAIEGTGKDVCDSSSTDFVIYECEDPGCTKYDKIENVAFVIFSKGEDLNGKGTETGTSASGPDCPSYSMPSCGAGKTCFYIRQQGACYRSRGNDYRYDDIVNDVSLFEIQRARRCK